MLVLLVIAAVVFLPEKWTTLRSKGPASRGWSKVDVLVALEVIWSPSADADRLSTAELTTLYPELARLDDRSVGGRVFCDHCRGPYAHEPRCAEP